MTNNNHNEQQQDMEQDDDPNNDQQQQQQQQQDGGAGAAQAQVVQVQGLPLDWTQMNNAAASPPPIRFPSNVAEWLPTDTEIMIVGTAGQKITHIGSDFSTTCGITPPSQLQQLILRSHLITKMEGLQGFTNLKLLELYDNQIEALECLGEGDRANGSPGSTLTTLDMSYNVIRDMAPVQRCPLVQELYLANNKLRTMTGLKDLVHLKKIDLGANRIRVIDANELSGLVNLEELWLGKNKIEKMLGLDKLVRLRRLDIQSNRLTQVENLQTQLNTLEELYLSHNGITNEGAASATGLAMQFTKLSVLDLSRNRLTAAGAFGHLTTLEELWLSGNKIASFADVQGLAGLGKSLETIYLEYNPLQQQDPLYRKKVHELIPSLTQIDATMIQSLAAVGLAPAGRSGGVAETGEEHARRLQNQVIERAKAETERTQQQQK